MWIYIPIYLTFFVVAIICQLDFEDNNYFFRSLVIADLLIIILAGGFLFCFKEIDYQNKNNKNIISYLFA
jgi:hypothetical protein